MRINFYLSYNLSELVNYLDSQYETELIHSNVHVLQVHSPNSETIHFLFELIPSAELQKYLKGNDGKKALVFIKNKGNFRNVQIVENINNRVVACFLLMEPGTTVKLRTEIPLTVTSSLVAQVENVVVSEYFYIYPLKIVEVVMNETTDVIIKNLCINNISNFGIFGEGFNPADIYNIGQYGALKLKYTYAIVTDKLVLYNKDDGQAISNYFYLENNSIDDLLNDLSADQKLLFQQVLEKNPNSDVIQLKLSVIKGDIRV